MDGNARAEPCTRKLAWFRSATCMVGLHNLHGSARRSAWLDFPKCMVQLSALHGWAFKTWFANQNDTPADHPSTTSARNASAAAEALADKSRSHPSTSPTSPTSSPSCNPPHTSSRRLSAHALNQSVLGIALTLRIHGCDGQVPIYSMTTVNILTSAS